MKSFTNLVWKPFDGVELHFIQCLFWIILFRIFRVVVYCLIIKVLVFAVWNSLFRLSYSLTFVKNFLIFFRPAFQLSVCHLFLKHSFVSSDSLLRISQAVVFVNCYFILFFRNNSRRFLIMNQQQSLFSNQLVPSFASTLLPHGLVSRDS